MWKHIVCSKEEFVELLIPLNIVSPDKSHNKFMCQCIYNVYIYVFIWEVTNWMIHLPLFAKIVPLVVSQGSFTNFKVRISSQRMIQFIYEIKIRCPILQVPSNSLHVTPMGFSHTLFHQLSRDSLTDIISSLAKEIQFDHILWTEIC